MARTKQTARKVPNEEIEKQKQQEEKGRKNPQVPKKDTKPLHVKEGRPVKPPPQAKERKKGRVPMEDNKEKPLHKKEQEQPANLLLMREK